MSNLTPREIVSELDKYIIGQDAAKRMVAIAMRNRWRRQQIDPELRDALRSIVPRTNGAHEHPPMVLSEAPKVGGFSAGTLSLQEPLE